MMKKTSFSPPAVGGTSLLVIFGVLCLTVFALLNLTTAQAEKRLSDSSAQAATAYYEADRQAEEIFARLRIGDSPDFVYWDGSICSYSIPISDYQTLQIQLLREESSWTVLRWQTCPVSDPGVEQTLSLWDGTTPMEVTP